MTIIRARVIMGNLEVIVPEGVHVDLDVMTIAGSRALRLSGPAPAPTAPVIRIVGHVIAGAMVVRDRASLRERIGQQLAGLLTQPGQEKR